MSIFGFTISGAAISALGGLIVLLGAYISSKENSQSLQDQHDQTRGKIEKVHKETQGISDTQAALLDSATDKTGAVDELIEIRKNSLAEALANMADEDTSSNLVKNAKSIGSSESELKAVERRRIQEFQDEFKKFSIPLLHAFCIRYREHIENLREKGHIASTLYQYETSNMFTDNHLIKGGGDFIQARTSAGTHLHMTYNSPAISASGITRPATVYLEGAQISVTEQVLNIDFGDSNYSIDRSKIDDKQHQSEFLAMVDKAVKKSITMQMANDYKNP